MIPSHDRRARLEAAVLRRVAHVPARAGDYIGNVDQLQCGNRVVIVARVSEWSQKVNGSLHRQLARLRDEAAARGLIVVAEFAVVWKASDPVWLMMAAEIAAEHGAVILAVDVTRLLRSNRFTPINQTPLPTAEEFEHLRFWTQGIPMVTIADPDAAARPAQTARGTAAVGNAGRPRAGESKRARRIRLMRPRVLELAAAGVPKHEISRRLKLPRRTVQRWLEGGRTLPTVAGPESSSPPYES